MAIKGAKTIAEYAIRKWLENENFVMDCFKLEFNGDSEATITDANGDSMALLYDSDTKQVIVG